MKKASKNIERSIWLVAVISGVIFLALIATLLIVQRSFGASQATLTSLVIPTQHVLSDLTGAVGDMFLRQSQILASQREGNTGLEDRNGHERGVRDCLVQLETLLASHELTDHKAFPQSASERLRDDVERFLRVDDELFDTVVQYHQLEQTFQDNLVKLDADLRRLMEDSSGLAGAIRLEYISLLRRIHEGIRDDVIDGELINNAIVGDQRILLSAINDLDAAVLFLGVLSGKVGLVASEDGMNSLIANRIAQNQTQILFALDNIEELVKDPNLAQRVGRLRHQSEDLLQRVGDESRPNSLATLRRKMLAANKRLNAIQRDATLASIELNAHTTALRQFAESLAGEARTSSQRTSDGTKYSTVGVCTIGLLLCSIALSRTRTSILGLRRQNERLTEVSEELVELNDGLENTIAERTAAIQLFLDSTGDGMISANLDGTLEPERSRAVTAWFGKAPPDVRLWDYLGQGDSKLVASLKMAFSQLAMDFLPFHVSAAQAPNRLQRDGRSYSLDYREVRRHGNLERVLVVIRDVTAKLEAERADADGKELHAIVKTILGDREGFQRAVDECCRLIEHLSQTKTVKLVLRGLHTIKGNTALIGFRRVAEFVHELETKLIADERLLTASELAELNLRWCDSLSQVEPWLEAGGDYVRVDGNELASVIELSKTGGDHEQILKLVESWQHQPTKSILQRLASRIQQIAERLEKDVEVEILDHELRVPPGDLEHFWATMVHVLRNAIDHGLEDEPERLLAGKPATGQVTLETSRVDGNFEFRISDDGRGINWDAIGAKAELLKLPHEDDTQLIEALFADGLTTRDTANEISGRGVGLGATRDACRELGGDVTIESTPGHGTSFIFRIPWPSATSSTDPVIAPAPTPLIPTSVDSASPASI